MLVALFCSYWFTHFNLDLRHVLFIVIRHYALLVITYIFLNWALTLKIGSNKLKLKLGGFSTLFREVSPTKTIFRCTSSISGTWSNDDHHRCEIFQQQSIWTPKSTFQRLNDIRSGVCKEDVFLQNEGVYGVMEYPIIWAFVTRHQQSD
jgi:hypothetical protein